MQVQNVLSAPVFLILLFLTYIVMWWFIRKHQIKKEHEDRHVD
ncbi:hypothetical protein [Piscibacillus salipiscarius]|uniref:Uncharacterized protein n=1 Tax=Piscibacillus salipiscarius TaxID=299480 RepID=A0ABW5QAA8_9BACI|nr:hypothetical protein [Piscibacillus salipiscarius]